MGPVTAISSRSPHRRLIAASRVSLGTAVEVHSHKRQIPLKSSLNSHFKQLYRLYLIISLVHFLAFLFVTYIPLESVSIVRPIFCYVLMRCVALDSIIISPYDEASGEIDLSSWLAPEHLTWARTLRLEEDRASTSLIPYVATCSPDSPFYPECLVLPPLPPPTLPLFAFAH